MMALSGHTYPIINPYNHVFIIHRDTERLGIRSVYLDMFAYLLVLRYDPAVSPLPEPSSTTNHQRLSFRPAERACPAAVLVWSSLPCNRPEARLMVGFLTPMNCSGLAWLQERGTALTIHCKKETMC